MKKRFVYSRTEYVDELEDSSDDKFNSESVNKRIKRLQELKKEKQ